MLIKNLSIKNLLYLQKILFICWGFFFILIDKPIANDAKIQLKEIQEKIKRNKLKQNELKKNKVLLIQALKKLKIFLRKMKTK